ALGLGTVLAALNVRYRDFRYVIPFLLQLGMFATPTIYMDPSTVAASRWAPLLAFNPMTALIASFRAAALGGPLPWTDLAISSTAALAIFLLGCLYFRRAEDSFADII
ncbi:MAG TPA: ABC transporter permease, partial [Candidatus Binatia bacterium]|nr:ABC transporter permease [Candidatus Binatia bacterium]